MKVSWSKKAGDAVVQTSVYILDKFGPKASEEFLQEVQHVSDLLESNPCLGPVEPLLAQKSKPYRSVVLNHLNKIVYYINRRYHPNRRILGHPKGAKGASRQVEMMKCRRHGLSKMLASGTALAVIWDN